MKQERKKEVSQGFAIRDTYQGVRVETIGYKTIPNAGFIRFAMNAAACEQFGLSPNFATEGGVCGVFMGSYIDLTNFGDENDVGVWNENWRNPRSKGESKVLGFYKRFISGLFEGQINFGEKTYPPGSLFTEEALRTDEAVFSIVMAQIKNMGGEDLAKKVMERLIKRGGRSYLRGLTNEEIIKQFVEPPNSEHKN